MAENQDQNKSNEAEIEGIVTDNDTDNESVSQESNNDEQAPQDQGDAEVSNPLEPTETNNTEKDEETFPVQNKSSKLKKILLILLIVLLLGGGGFAAYYYLFMQEEAKPIENENNVTEPIKPRYNFNINHINTDRVNKKLALLTKYEIIEDPKTEMQKQKELEEMNNTIALADEYSSSNGSINLQGENLDILNDDNQSSEITPTIENNTPVISINEDNNEQAPLVTNDNSTNESNISVKVDVELISDEVNKTVTELDIEIENNNTNVNVEKENVINNKNQFLKFVQVATLKYNLYQSFLNKIKEVDARISLCKDMHNKTQILIGPFMGANDNRNMIISEINKNVVTDAFAIELTNEEFNRRCGGM